MAPVSLEKINKVYENGFHAVKDLSVNIADGEFMVLVGPSGCGKTTALRMVAGLEDITSGVLRIDGKEANDRLAQCRLAHSVAADERKNSVLEPQFHALQCVAASIKDVQSPDFQKIGGAALRHGRCSRDKAPALPDPPRSRLVYLL